MNIELLGENKNIIKCIDDPTCAPDPRGLGVHFMEKMMEYRNKVAQIDAETGKTLTYGELLLQSIRVAQHLQEKSIKQDDIIILCSRNNMELSFPIFAGLFLKNRIAFLDPTLPKYEVDYLLKLAKPRFIFSEESCADTLADLTTKAQLPTEIVVFGETEKHTPFSWFQRPTGTENEFKAQPVKSIMDTAVIFFSSGTTGYPKGICATHHALQTYQAALSIGCDTSVMLAFSSFYWISATMVLVTCLLNGSIRIVSDGFNVDTAMEIISKYKVTFAYLAQFFSYQLTHKYKSTDYDTSKLNTLSIIGDKLSKEEMENVRKLFPHSTVNNGYGMTEANSCIFIFDTTRDKDLIKIKDGACGRPIQGFTYKIVNPDTEEILGPHQTGELRIKGAMMNGYLNNPEATKKVFDDDGFFKTGDLAYYDEDYCFYMIGREKDMLKYRGMIQSPIILESILRTHPEIKEAVIVGKPDVADGDHPAAFIILQEGSQLTKEIIIKFYNEKIENYEPQKLRGGVYIVDTIPRTPSGKARKRLLRDCLINNH